MNAFQCIILWAPREQHFSVYHTVGTRRTTPLSVSYGTPRTTLFIVSHCEHPANNTFQCIIRWAHREQHLPVYHAVGTSGQHLSVYHTEDITRTTPFSVLYGGHHANNTFQCIIRRTPREQHLLVHHTAGTTRTTPSSVLYDGHPANTTFQCIIRWTPREQHLSVYDPEPHPLHPLRTPVCVSSCGHPVNNNTHARTHIYTQSNECRYSFNQPSCQIYKQNQECDAVTPVGLCLLYSSARATAKTGLSSRVWDIKCLCVASSRMFNLYQVTCSTLSTSNGRHCKHVLFIGVSRSRCE